MITFFFEKPVFFEIILKYKLIIMHTYQVALGEGERKKGKKNQAEITPEC